MNGIVSSIEESGEVYSLDTKEIVDTYVAKIIYSIKDLGRTQFNLCVKEKLVDRGKSLYAVIPKEQVAVVSLCPQKRHSEGQESTGICKIRMFFIP